MEILISSRSLLLILFSLSLVTGAVIFEAKAADSKPVVSLKSQTKKAPLRVVSDKMIAQKDSSMVEFIGNVKATQTDSVVIADSIKVFFADNSKDKSNENNVKKIIASGHVEYTAGDRKAFADKAVYTTVDETLILTGEQPKLITGSSFVTGKKITLFRNEDKVIVESDGKKRVEALFNPEDAPAQKP